MAMIKRRVTRGFYVRYRGVGVNARSRSNVRRYKKRFLKW